MNACLNSCEMAFNILYYSYSCSFFSACTTVNTQDMISHEEAEALVSAAPPPASPAPVDPVG